MTGDGLSLLEIATGVLLPDPARARTRTRNRRRRGLPEAAPMSPREALERAILPALLRPPCLVSFSGGRDSAAVLAVATALARREGLPAPIPATNVFPAADDSDETAWQELIVRHLGLSEWVRTHYGDELDLIGPYAERALKSHGLLWPANTHFHLPLLEAAPGGSLLTGIGGDELYLAARRLRAEMVLSRAVRPRPRDVLSLGFAFSPVRVRQAVIARRGTLEAPWLRPSARRLATARLTAEAAAEPGRLEERLAWWQRRRYLEVGMRSLDLIASETTTEIVHPLLAPEFWSAVAGAAAPAGFTGRTEGVRRLFGDLLPSAIVERKSKANFDSVFWTERSRAFVREWDGSGVPEEWVDAGELARHWAGPRPSLPSSLLLQAAWLHSIRDGVEQERECVLQ